MIGKNNMAYYVAMDIGCIECGEESEVLGIFTDETLAQNECDAADEIQKNNWHGQHYFAVFPVETINRASSLTIVDANPDRFELPK